MWPNSVPDFPEIEQLAAKLLWFTCVLVGHRRPPWIFPRKWIFTIRSLREPTNAPACQILTQTDNALPSYWRFSKLSPPFFRSSHTDMGLLRRTWTELYQIWEEHGQARLRHRRSYSSKGFQIPVPCPLRNDGVSVIKNRGQILHFSSPSL